MKIAIPHLDMFNLLSYTFNYKSETLLSTNKMSKEAGPYDKAHYRSKAVTGVLWKLLMRCSPLTPPVLRRNTS